MYQPPPSRANARLARGGITWVTVLLLALLAGGGYLAWMWFPVFIVNFEAKQVVRDYANQAVRNPNDAELVQKMTQKLATLDDQDLPDGEGNAVPTPTVQVDPAEVTWERDATSSPPTLHVAFTYTRAVEYPLLGRWTEVTLSIDVVNDLSRPDWGPVR
jgi:hypothetical protein